jgi:hypothetical protein
MTGTGNSPAFQAAGWAEQSALPAASRIAASGVTDQAVEGLLRDPENRAVMYWVWELRSERHC